MTAPKIDQQLASKAKDILVHHWDWAKHLPYNATPKETLDAIKLALTDRYPDVKFKLRLVKGKYDNHTSIRINWVRYPKTPDASEVEDIVAPYGFWRFQKAEAELSKHGIVMDSILLNALLKSTWGPRRGLGISIEQPTEKQTQEWKAKQASTTRRALKEIADMADASRPRAKRKLAM